MLLSASLAKASHVGEGMAATNFAATEVSSHLGVRTFHRSLPVEARNLVSKIRYVGTRDSRAPREATYLQDSLLMDSRHPRARCTRRTLRSSTKMTRFTARSRAVAAGNRLRRKSNPRAPRTRPCTEQRADTTTNRARSRTATRLPRLCHRPPATMALRQHLKVGANGHHPQ